MARLQRRYYYLPVSALWMLERFGIRCCDDSMRPLSRAELCRLVLEQPERKLRVHPASELLFGPQLGDVYFRSCQGSYHNVTEKGAPRRLPSGEIVEDDLDCDLDDITLEQAQAWWNGGASHDEIVKRGEVAFHTPEMRLGRAAARPRCRQAVSLGPATKISKSP